MEEEMERCRSKDTKLQIYRMAKSRDLTYNCEDFYNTVLGIFAKRIDFRSFCHPKKKG